MHTQQFCSGGIFSRRFLYPALQQWNPGFLFPSCLCSSPFPLGFRLQLPTLNSCKLELGSRETFSFQSRLLASIPERGLSVGMRCCHALTCATLCKHKKAPWGTSLCGIRGSSLARRCCFVTPGLATRCQHLLPSSPEQTWWLGVRNARQEVLSLLVLPGKKIIKWGDWPHEPTNLKWQERRQANETGWLTVYWIYTELCVF